MKLATRVFAISVAVSPALASAQDPQPEALAQSSAEVAPAAVEAQLAAPKAAAVAEGPSAEATAPAASSGTTELDAIRVSPAEPPAPQEKTPPKSASRVIEEIVVTAQKREENLQEVPISITAFSGEKLDALGVGDARDLELVTPGLVYSTNPVNYSIIYIRGIGTDAFIPSVDSSVATYVDGVYFPYNHGLASSFSEIERIEVLKGPQGTLFGRNTTGGALNIITRKPDEELHARLSQSIESFDRHTTKAYLSGTLIGDLSGSVAAIYDDGNTNYKAQADSPVQARPTRQDKGLNLKLRWLLTDNLAANLSGYVTKSDTTLVNTAEAVKPAGILIGVRPGESSKYNSNLDGFLKTKNQVAYTNLEWNTDPVDVRVFGSYQDVDAQTLYDFDGSQSNGVYFDVPTEFVRATTAELQILSKPGGAFTFHDTLEYTLGYYFYKSIGGYANVYFGVAEPLQTAATSQITLAGLLGTGLNTLNALGIPLQDNIELELNGVVDTIAHAVYAQTTWKPVDWAGLTLGARAQTEDRGIVKARSGLSRRPDAGPIPLFNFPRERTQTDSISPKATLEVKPFGDDTLLYTSWQKGIKSGTYNLVAIYTAPNFIKPERVTAVELGIKGDFLDKTFVYSAAVFRNEIKNVQTLNISLVSGGAVQLANADKATIDGVEFEATWQALPELAPGFVITANGSFLDGTYDRFPNASGFNEVTGVYFGRGQLVPAPPQDFAGNETVRTPDFSGTLGLSYTFEVPGGNLELGANGSYNAGYFYDTQNVNEQPEYTLFNARVSYLYEPWNVRVSLSGQNLTDEQFFYDKLINDFVTNALYAPGRAYGLTVGWEL